MSSTSLSTLEFVELLARKFRDISCPDLDAGTNPGTIQGIPGRLAANYAMDPDSSTLLTRAKHVNAQQFESAR